jgi:hypothetical protein
VQKEDEGASPTASGGVVKSGDRFAWAFHSIVVNRVARNGSWADVTVTQPFGASWNKRQPLPFPADWRRAS